MKRLLPLAALLLALTCVNASAQDTTPTPDMPRPLDAFGAINYSDLAARLDNFAIELQNEPSARGLIVVYPRPDKFPGWYLRRAYWAKGYLVKTRGIDPARVEVVNGGYGDELKFELWALPPGARPPAEPFDWAAALSREKSPMLFDREVFENNPPAISFSDVYEDNTDPKDRYEPFVSALRADPAARGLIIAYATRRDARGADRRLAAREKLSIMKLHSIGAERIAAVGGGLRKNRTVEFWIVPPGAEPPKPTPDVRPARGPRRRRR